MEFFEKAHVSKSKHASKKSDETVKKQLKQMLYGYRQSDNELIKSSAISRNDFDDSASISGFSDLNITLSSTETDNTQELGSEAVDGVCTVSDISVEEIDFMEDTNRLKDTSLDSGDSISEYHGNFQSLSDDLPPKDLSSSVSDDEMVLDNTSVTNSLNSLSNTSSTSETFDQDGSLAFKILERLENEKKKDSKKRKIVPSEQNHLSSKEIKDKTPKKNKKNTIQIKSQVSFAESFSSDEEIIIPTEHYESKENENSEIAFETIRAENLEGPSFNEILGDYRHPTVFNILTERTFSPIINEEGLVDQDNMLDEEVDSMIPDLDEQSLEQIDLDSTCDSTEPLNETTSAHDDTFQTEETSEKSEESVENILHSVNVYYGRNCCVFVMKHPAQIYIHGKVRATCFKGTVEVQGFTLGNETCKIYALHNNHAHCMKTVECKKAPSGGILNKLTSSGLSIEQAEDIMDTVGNFDAIVHFSTLQNKVMEFVQNNFSVSDLFARQTRYYDSSLKKASDILGCPLYLYKPNKCYEENEIWKQVVEFGSTSSSRGIVCGGKGVGKSTFVRHYVNRLLSKGPVLVIDLDPGQAEFTVAGNVSATVVKEPLLGPNFTHLKKPELMLNIGLINTMDNPTRYITAVRNLLTYCCTDARLAKMPWIVNTMGMTNAMGLKLITLIILELKPTFLFQIDSKTPKKRFECHLYPNTVNCLYDQYRHDRLFRAVNYSEVNYSFFVNHHSDSVKSNNPLAPRDERYLNFLAYFGELVHMQGSKGILDVVPYEVPIKDLYIGMNVRIQSEAVTKVINGKVVALCQHEPRRRAQTFTLQDEPIKCLGYGLIRGVDIDKGLLYITTPTPFDTLCGVNTLVYADWVPEVRGQERELPDGTSVPYRTATIYQQRQLMFPPRRRYNPLQFLKMSKGS